MAVAQQPTTRQPASPKPAGTHDAMFRRVAIVLSSLPAHVSNRLMSGLSSDTRHILRQEIHNLSDVDPLERRRAYQAFKGSVIQQQGSTSEHVSQSGDTLESAASHSRSETMGTSRVYRVDDAGEHKSGAETHDAIHPNNPTHGNHLHSEMNFLGDIDDEVLARVIADEHPQAIALVLASIAPAQAARIVTTLEPRLQSEALNRIARLDDASSEAMTEFAEHFAKVERFGTQTFARGGSAGGQDALRAILDAMPQPESPHRQVPAGHDRQSSPSSSGVAVQHASMVDETLRPPEPTENDSVAIDHALDSSGASKVSEQDVLLSEESHSAAPLQLSTVNINPFESTDAIHQHLVQLSPQELCRVLAEVETRQALLTLCGLPNHVADKVLAALPRSQAKQVRARLGSLGNLQLREIDEAKEMVALISIGWNPNGSRQNASPHSTTNPASAEVPVAA